VSSMSVSVIVTFTCVPAGVDAGLPQNVHDLLRDALPDSIGLSARRLQPPAPARRVA